MISSKKRPILLNLELDDEDQMLFLSHKTSILPAVSQLEDTTQPGRKRTILEVYQSRELGTINGELKSHITCMFKRGDDLRQDELVL